MSNNPPPGTLPAPLRRGRPYRPPVDTSDWNQPFSGADVRIAWLLGTWRLTALDGAFAHRRDFLPRLAAACPDSTCDDPGVSRWEKGVRTPNASVLAGYERVLELPEFSLRSMRHNLDPSLVWVPRPRLSSARSAHFEELLDLVVDHEPRGADWVNFAESLVSLGQFFVRSAIWETVCARLVSEAGRALHTGYLSRRAAIRLLLSHPKIAPFMVEAITTYVATPGQPRRADLAAMAQFAGTDLAADLAIEFLADADEATRYGGLRATSALLAKGVSDPGLVTAAVEFATAALAADPGAFVVADLVTRLPDAEGALVRRRVGDHPAQELIDQNDEVVPPDLASSFSASLATLAWQEAPPELRRCDPMLMRVVREALFHANAERRGLAAHLATQSPYRAGLAHALRRVLPDAPAAAVQPALGLLRHWVTAEEIPGIVEALETPSPYTQLQALHALASSPIPLSPSVLVALKRTEWPSARHAEAARHVLEMHDSATTRARLVA